MKDRIEKALDAIRPAIRKDGGDIEIAGLDEAAGVVRVRLLGACRDCALSKLTLRLGVEATLMREVPELRAVEAVA